MDSTSTDTGWGPPVSSDSQPAQAQITPSSSDVTAQPGMLAYVNSLTSNGVAPTDALKMAMKMPQYASSKFSFSPSADGKSFVDNASASEKSDAGWGPTVSAPAQGSNKFVQAPASLPVKAEQAYLDVTNRIADSIKSGAKTAGSAALADVTGAAKAAAATVKQDISNFGKNTPGRQMTPAEFQAARALNILPKGSTLQSAYFNTMAPAGQKSPTVARDTAAQQRDPIGWWLLDSAPANVVKGIFSGTQQERTKYDQIQTYLAQKKVLTDPAATPAQKSAAMQTINSLRQPSESVGKFFSDLHKAFTKDPTGTVGNILKGVATDPELLGASEGKVGTALSDAAKSAGMSEKIVSSMKRLENTIHGATQGAGINVGIRAAQGFSTPTGTVTPEALGTAAAQGAALGGAVGAARGLGEPLSPDVKIEPDPENPGWGKPVNPLVPSGGEPVTTDKVLPHQSETAQLRLGKGGDVNAPHEPGQPIATNTPIDNSGTVPLTGGTSEDLKGLHVDKEFPSTKDLTDRAGQKITLPVKDIVTQVHEAEEAPLMHPVGPVPVDAIHSLMDRAGSFATPKIFSPAILKDIADGKPLSYQDAHNIATAIENNHVESNYNVDHKVYQDSLLPHIKQIEERSKVEPKSDVPATLGNKPYDDSNLSHMVEGQGKPSVGGLPEDKNTIQENNASGESSASMEAINRLQQERANGQERYLINRDGSVEPVIGVDGVDKVARPGQVIVQKNVGIHKWTVLSHGPDVSPDMAQGYVNRASVKLAQAGKVDPKLLLALGAGALGAVAGSYIYQKHPVKGAMVGATAAMMLAGSHPIKFLAALRDATSGSKKINIASFLDTRDGMMADSSRARVQAQDRLAKMIPTKQERINVDNYLDDPKRYPNVTPNEKQAANYIRNVYDSLGKVAMQHGVLDAMIKDYNSRRWEQTSQSASILQQILAAKQKASATGTSSIHNINRVFVTKAEGIAAGLKPVTEDAIENLGMYWDSMTRTIANKITLDSLKNGKLPGTSNTLIMPAGKAPASYVANSRIPGMMVHPDIAQQLAQVYYLKDVNPFVRGLSAINTLQKRSAVIASAFHAVSLAQAHFSANSVLHPIKNTRDIITSMLGKSDAHKLLMTGGPKDPLGGLLRAGMKVQLPQGDGVDIDYNQDYYPALKAAQGYLNSVIPGSGKVVGGIEKVSKLSDKYVFTYAHAGMKMSTGLSTLSRMQMSWAKELQKNPHTIVPSDEHMQKEVASFVNNVYGGLDWRKAADEAQTELGKMLSYAAYGPTGRTLLSFAFFAPDWLISTLRAAAKAPGIGPSMRRRAGTATTEEMLYHSGGTGFNGFINPKTATDFHRLYQVRNAFYFMLIGSALNFYFSGHGLLDNEKDGISPLRVDMGNGEYMEFNKHGMEAYTMLEDPKKFFINKMGVIPKEAGELLLNKDYLNASGGAPPYSGILQHAASDFTPFTFSNMIGKSPRDIALNIAGAPVYGKTNEQRYKDKERGIEKAKETRREHLSEDPLYYYHKRQDARERKLRGG